MPTGAGSVPPTPLGPATPSRPPPRQPPPAHRAQTNVLPRLGSLLSVKTPRFARQPPARTLMSAVRPTQRTRHIAPCSRLCRQPEIRGKRTVLQTAIDGERGHCLRRRRPSGGLVNAGFWCVTVIACPVAIAIDSSFLDTGIEHALRIHENCRVISGGFNASHLPATKNIHPSHDICAANSPVHRISGNWQRAR